MRQNLILVFCLTVFCALAGTTPAMAQTASPTPSTKHAEISTNKAPRKRATGIKITDDAPSPAAQTDSDKPQKAQNTPAPEKTEPQVPSPEETERAARETEIERKKAAESEQDRRKAADAALERENKRAADAAAEKVRLEYAEKERELQKKLDDEKQAREAEADKMRVEAETEKKRLAAEAETARQKIAAEAETERQRLAAEAAENKRIADEREAEKQAEIARLKAQSEKEQADRLEAEKQAEIARKQVEEAENKRIETEKLAREASEKQKLEAAALRQQTIESVAKKIGFLDPAQAAPLVPADVYLPVDVETALSAAAEKNPRLVKRANFCDEDFRGETLDLMQSAPLTMSSFLDILSYRYRVSFIPDAEILDLPVYINTSGESWDFVLRTQLNFNDLEYKCTPNGSIAILKRAKFLALQEAQRKSEKIVTRTIKFRYLQADTGGTVDVAGRSSQGGGKGGFETLEEQIAKLLKDDPRASVARAGTKNALIIRATESQFRDIQTNIEAADVPNYRVIVYAKVYTANKNRLRNLGGNVAIVAGTGNLNRLGGVSSFPGSENSASGGQSAGGSSGANGGSTGSAGGSTGATATGLGAAVPGGVRSLGPGFAFPENGGISAGFSGIFGTTQFSAQLNALLSNGVAEVRNDPTVVTDDGVPAKIDLGRQVPIAIPIFSGGVQGNANLQILNAGNTLAVTPQVLEDADGKPTKVRLSIQLESNEVDQSVGSQGIPSIQRRSAQNRVTVGTDETVVIGGFTTVTKSKSISKAPLLGDIPGFGYLFKNKTDQEQELYIYFAVRAVVVMNDEQVKPYPVEIDTTPLVPIDDFFKPSVQPARKLSPIKPDVPGKNSPSNN